MLYQVISAAELACPNEVMLSAATCQSVAGELLLALWAELLSWQGIREIGSSVFVAVGLLKASVKASIEIEEVPGESHREGGGGGFGNRGWGRTAAAAAVRVWAALELPSKNSTTVSNSSDPIRMLVM